MSGTQGLAGHDEARALAVVLAGLRAAPPSGLTDLGHRAWHEIRSICWRSDRYNPTITVETMRIRQSGSRRRTSGPLGTDHPLLTTLQAAASSLREVAGRTGQISVEVMVAYPGWQVSVDALPGEEQVSELPVWHCDEALAISSSEWPEFVVQQDADERDRGMYAANALLRVAIWLDRTAADETDPERRHWRHVDAEILRRTALREHPTLDPDFRPQIRLVA